MILKRLPQKTPAHKGSDASKSELDAKNEHIKVDPQKFYQRLLKTDILPEHNAGMREKGSWWEEGKGGGNVL